MRTGPALLLVRSSCFDRGRNPTYKTKRLKPLELYNFNQNSLRMRYHLAGFSYSYSLVIDIPVVEMDPVLAVAAAGNRSFRMIAEACGGCWQPRGTGRWRRLGAGRSPGN